MGIRSYLRLKRFQKHQQNLANICDDLQSIISNANNRRILSDTLKNRIFQSCKKLKLESFRVAVVGEFNQGKSTLLNALLGEEIQPVREIPCSGTITVLKYGKQKRVVCRYKDGREEEIQFEQYQEKAAISEDAALGNLRDELAETEIEEIICYHPDLDLCRSGVEILDSPGLNEHPERTAIVNKLLEEVDAVIFLTNATRSLTQGERDLLQDLRHILNLGKGDEPANNLFVVVNFWDLLRTEKGRQQVQKRIENLVMGESPIIAGENRLHFISAQSALDAIMAENDDEYLINFKKFVAALENFMAAERGALKIQQSVTKINGLIQESLGELKQAENLLEGKVKLSEEAKRKIFEQIGEASGRFGKITYAAKQLTENNKDKVKKSWKNWIEGLASRITEESEKWCSGYSPLSDGEKVVQDYTQQFKDSLANEVETWVNTQVKDIVLKELNLKAYNQLPAIRANLQKLDLEVNTNLNEQFNLAIKNWKGYGLDAATGINLGEVDYKMLKWFRWTRNAVAVVAAGIIAIGLQLALVLLIVANDDSVPGYIALLGCIAWPGLVASLGLIAWLNKPSAVAVVAAGLVSIIIYIILSIVQNDYSVAGLIALLGLIAWPGLIASLGLIAWLNKPSRVNLKKKQQVLKSGLKKFTESSDEVFKQIYKNASKLFIKSVSAVIDRAIHLYEDLLEQQEIINNKTAEECNEEKASINADFQRLEKMQNQLEAILNEATSS